jgi:hypothetical protein
MFLLNGVSVEPTISVVVDQIETLFVVYGCKVGLSHSKTDTITESLPKGTCCHLDT